MRNRQTAELGSDPPHMGNVSKFLRALSTEYAPLRSLDDALVVANNNARDENFHKFSSGEYVTLLPSDQSPLPDSTLLAIFSAICRLRRSAHVVTELLESCHRNTNKDSSLPGGTIRDSQLNLPGVRPSDPSHQPKRPLPAPESSPSRKPKNRKRDYSCHKRSTSSTRTLTPNSRGPSQNSRGGLILTAQVKSAKGVIHALHRQHAHHSRHTRAR